MTTIHSKSAFSRQDTDLTPGVMMVGASHRNMTLATLADFIVHPDRQAALVDNILRATKATEAVLLVTCNRCEIYLAVERYDEDIKHCFATLATGRDDPDIQCLHMHTALDVVRHLLLVACGCDAIVIGETQILGQIKEAYRRAHQQRRIGATLSHLFDYALTTAKSVRHRTKLDRHSTSFASAALRLAGRLFENPYEKNILFIGTGDMIRTMSRQFSVRSFKNFTFAGRSAEKARELAEELEGRAISIDAALNDWWRYDIIVSCTASEVPLISREVVDLAMKKRHYRAQCIIDLALPCDVEPTVSEIADAYLFDLDGLSEIIAEHQNEHLEARAMAVDMIEDSVREYQARAKALNAVDFIKSWRGAAEDARADAAAKAIKQLEDGVPTAEVIQRLSEQLTNKLLHPITELLKHVAETENEVMVEYLRQCMNGDDEEKK